ncbi:MAG: GxxExxY protein [Candidatus Margulisiibacteriota bacterium]|nr:GxxExxY protein [Candidatus Margulisiibacteriota bacterium]
MGKEDLVHPELSYGIVGILFKVYNQMGGGYQEKYYQEAIKRELFINQIPFLEQVRCDFNYEGQLIGRYYIDFIIDHKVVLELKVTPAFAKKDIVQVLNYLRQSNLKLGILASLNRNNVFYKRILKGK